MDLSEFKPPVRLSMSDEDIQSALGSASANEEGMLAAMAMLEEQANLREYDNQQLAAWVVKMQSDPRPQAAIALQNLERAKSGLEPLPLEAAEEVLPAVVSVEEVQPVPAEEEPVPAPTPAIDEFDAMLAEATVEATTAVELPPVVEEAVIAPVEVEPVVPASNFEVSADEDATALEEEQTTKTVSAPKDWSWLLKLGTWSLFGAVIPAISLAIMSALSFGGFATTTLGFAIGTVAAYGVHLAGFATASRGERSFSVVTRATFGVWGAGLPGLVALVARLAVFGSLLLVSVNSSAIAFPTLPAASSPVLLGVPLGLILTAVAVLAVGLLVAFAQRALAWVYAVVGGLVLVSGLVLALLSTRAIDFGSLQTELSISGIFATASVAFLVQGVATFALDSRGFASRATMPQGTLQQVLYPIFYVLIPVALFAHVQAIFDTNAIGFLFGTSPIEQTLFGDFASSVTMVAPWVLLVALIALLIGLFDSSVEALGAFGINSRSWWQALVLVVAVVAGLVLMPEQENWFVLATVSVTALAANLGAVAAEALLRRGAYHDASLLRGYGFYKRFNVLGLVTFVLAVAVVLVVTGIVDLTSLGLNVSAVVDAVAPYAAFLAFGITFVLTFATSIPRIREQQAEAKDIEERRQALSSVYTG